MMASHRLQPLWLRSLLDAIWASASLSSSEPSPAAAGAAVSSSSSISGGTAHVMDADVLSRRRVMAHWLLDHDITVMTNSSLVTDNYAASDAVTNMVRLASELHLIHHASSSQSCVYDYILMRLARLMSPERRVTSSLDLQYVISPSSSQWCHHYY